MLTQYHVYLDTWCGVWENEKPKTGGFPFFVFRSSFFSRGGGHPAEGGTSPAEGGTSSAGKCEKCDGRFTGKRA